MVKGEEGVVEGGFTSRSGLKPSISFVAQPQTWSRLEQGGISKAVNNPQKIKLWWRANVHICYLIE